MFDAAPQYEQEIAQGGMVLILASELNLVVHVSGSCSNTCTAGTFIPTPNIIIPQHPKTPTHMHTQTSSGKEQECDGAHCVKEEQF